MWQPVIPMSVGHHQSGPCSVTSRARPAEFAKAIDAQGVCGWLAPPNGPRVAFEDDVIVTADGHKWISGSVPFAIEEIEKLPEAPSPLDVLP